MGATSDEVSRIGWQPFYWLKISGLPFYFWATVDPTASAFGSFAWTLPTGYTGKRGMDVPSDTIEQKLPDLVGGIASAARCRLRLIDIDQYDSSGPYKMFGRLIAPGRARNVSAVTWGFLNADLLASASTGDTFEVRGATAFPAAPSTAYIGQEAITYSAKSGISGGVQTFTIDARQKFPAVDNWNGITWPPPALYRVLKDASTNETLPSANLPVSSDAVGMIGRTAALYCGHIDPNGTPTAEADGVLLIAGRLKGFEYSGGAWLAELESVIADLSQGVVAPQLESAEIRGDQIVVPQYAPLQTFLIGIRHQDKVANFLSAEIVIQVAAGNYLLQELCSAINAAIAAATPPSGPWGNDDLKSLRCDTYTGEGEGRRVRFTRAYGTPYSDVAANFYVRHGYDGTAFLLGDVSLTGARHDQSLLSFLGFGNTQDAIWAVDPASTAGGHPTAAYNQVVLADNPAPWIAFAFTGIVPVDLLLFGRDAPGSRFFEDQGDGSNTSWARLDNGAIVRVTGHTSGTVSIDAAVFGPQRPGELPGDGRFFFAPAGSSAHIEQVIIAPDNWIQPPSSARLLGQFIASDSGATAADDFNFYPPGIGFGLGALLDKSSWRIGDSIGGRRIVVDRETKLADILDAVCKELGFFIVWDPVAGKITLRQLHMPSRVGASNLQFNESNRASPADITQSRIDMSSMRTGWSIAVGWDAAQQKFVGPTLKVNDYFPMAVYGISAKEQKIEDKSLDYIEQAGAIIDELLSKRGAFYEYPWTRMQRTVQKGAIFQSPGSVHKVIDASIHNPYTGAFGIVTGDSIYGLLTSVSIVPQTGLVNVELAIQSRQPPTRIRLVAPVGLIAKVTSGGYTDGYLTGPPDKIKMDNYYTQQTGTVFDGIDFAVGDNIRITTKNNDGAPAYTYSDTIAAISVDGQEITLTTGGWAPLSTDGESIIIGETYGGVTPAQAGLVAYLGSAENGEVSSGIPNMIWG
jgi:hypothetical protein